MEKEEMKKAKQPKWKFIRNIIITLIALAIVAGIFWIAPDYLIPRQDQHLGPTLIINNKDVTSSERLKNEVIIENGVIYLSKSDVSNFFDKYLYYDQKYDQYITTSGDKSATIKVGESKITINGISSYIKGKIIQKGEQVYFPLSDMNEVYNIDIKHIESTDTVLIDSLDREQVQAQAVKNLSVKVKPKFFSRTIDKIEENSTVVWISENDDGWVKIRTDNGKIGYVKTNDLTNKTSVRQDTKETPQISDKISLVWDYYSQYAKVPDRQGITLSGVNVISPSFFELEKLGKGNVIDKVGTDGKKYINWATQNGYKIWPMVANDSMIETTSEILNDYELRQKLIETIIKLVKTYNLDGINIDFENMYKNDKDLFSRFIIELYPRLKECNAVLAVDVTAPDGSDTWSQCFDRKVIADNSDYVIFMAYDQYSVGSTKAGPTAGYNWVKTNVDKFLGQEGVNKEKIILGIPFYMRLWSEETDGKLSGTPKTVNMKDINNAIPKTVERNWDDVLKVDYAQYEENGKTKKIWIEDVKSIREKLLLIKTYDLAGAAFWALDRQDDGVWDVINEVMFNK